MNNSQKIQVLMTQSLLAESVADIDVCVMAAKDHLTHARRIVAGIQSESPRLASLRAFLDSVDNSLTSVAHQARNLELRLVDLEALGLTPNNEDRLQQLAPGCRSLSNL